MKAIEPRASRAAILAVAVSLAPAAPAAVEQPPAGGLPATGVDAPILVSAGPNGEYPDAPCGSPTISGDGRVVGFVSAAENLLPGNRYYSQLYTYDRVTGVLARESVTPAGSAATGHSLFGGSLSESGRFIAFASDARDLVPGVTTGRNVYVRDRLFGVTRVLPPPTGRWQLDFPPDVVLSADGRAVLVLDGQATLYAFDVESAALLSAVDLRPTTAPVRVDELSSSRDGRYVAFRSADPILPGVEGVQLYVHDRVTGRTTVESRSSGEAGSASISGDGRLLVSKNLVPGDLRMFLTDRLLGRTIAIPYEGNAISAGPILSADGAFLSYVVFSLADAFDTTRAEIYEIATGARIGIASTREVTPVAGGVVAFRSSRLSSHNGIFVAAIRPPVSSPGISLAYQLWTDGSMVSLTWTEPSPAPPAYWLEVGSAPGAGDLGRFLVGRWLPPAPIDPRATYYVRVRAATPTGTGVVSNEVVISAAAPPPPAPTALRAGVAGTTVTLSWDVPSFGSPPTRYRIEAGSGFGLSDVGGFDTAGPETTMTVKGVPAGTYVVRVRAANSSGVGLPSAEVVVVVP